MDSLYLSSLTVVCPLPPGMRAFGSLITGVKNTLSIPPSPRAPTTRLHPHHKQMPESLASQLTAHLLGERPPPLTGEEAEAVLFRQFRGWTFTERQGAHRHWSWQYGWDISKGVERKFACKVCISDRSGRLRPLLSVVCKTRTIISSKISGFQPPKDSKSRRPN